MQKDKRLKQALLYGIMLILTGVFMFPVVWMLASSFKNEAQIFHDIDSFRAFLPPVGGEQGYFVNYAQALERVPLLRYLLNSLFYVSVLIIFGLLVNSMAAYAFARLRFPFRDFLFAVVVALIIIPLESIFLPLYLLMDRFGWVNTYQALIIPFVANAFNIFLFRQFFLSFPTELEEAAKMDGASVWRTFFQLVVPLSKPAFATVAVLTFVLHWSDFLWPLMVTTDDAVRPIQVGLQFFFHQPPVQYGQVMAALTMATIPVVVIFLFFQKYYIQGVSRTGMKN